MIKRTRCLSNAICNIHKIFLSEYIWTTLTFRVTGSHNSTCISSNISDNGPKKLVSRTWPYKVTWRHRSYDHSINNILLPLGVPLEPSLYLQPLYLYISISRPWPFRVTWPFDFPGAISCRCSIVTSQIRDNGPQTYSGHELHLSTSCDVIGHVTNRSAICHLLLVSH